MIKKKKFRGGNKPSGKTRLTQRNKYIKYLGEGYNKEEYNLQYLKSVFETKRNTLRRQIRVWLKKHGVITPIPFPNIKWFYSKFIELNNLECPQDTNHETFLYHLYQNVDFELLGARTVRPEITTLEWNRLKNLIFEKYGKVCLKCRSTEHISLDHIKPYSIYPELAIDPNNLQPLCRSCNSTKGNRNITDYRKF
jgi:5-methylcytosine-specific restriction endonuclease McrA